MARDKQQQIIPQGGRDSSTGLDDQHVDAQEYAALLDLYDNSFRNMAEGEVVKGTVLKVTEAAVVVDVGYKSEGLIPIHEFLDEKGITCFARALDGVPQCSFVLQIDMHAAPLFAANGLDFLVYPTVQVVPPTHEELAGHLYSVLTFPTNTVVASQTGLPALTIPVGFTCRWLP